MARPDQGDESQGFDFEALPPLDDEWVNEAGAREETAEQRAERYRRIAAGHARIRAQEEADRLAEARAAVKSQRRPWIIVAVVAAVLVTIVVIL